MTSVIESSYLKPAVDPADIQHVIDELKYIISENRLEFDAIAFCGMSGALVAPILGYVIKTPIVCVRKDNDGTHSFYLLEGTKEVKTYLIVDDLISTGKTIRHITSRMAGCNRGKCIAILLYNDGVEGVWNGRCFDNIPVFGFEL